MITLCELNFIFIYNKSKNQEKEAGTNFVLLSFSRNMIEPFMKANLQRPMKIQRFLIPERIQKRCALELSCSHQPVLCKMHQHFMSVYMNLWMNSRGNPQQ